MSKETTPVNPAKDQALKQAVAMIEKSFGKGAIMVLDGTTSLAGAGIGASMAKYRCHGAGRP